MSDSLHAHNLALIQNGYFTAANLEANRQGRYSPGRIKQMEDQRANIRETAPKYQSKGWLLSLIFGIGLCFFAVVLSFVGVFDTLQKALEPLFLPVTAGVGFFA